jgi:hypothetical protein
MFSYLYHFVLSLFLMGVAIVAMSSSNTLRLDMLPWTGSELTSWLFWGGLAGLIVVTLAVTGIFRYLFPLWALVVLVMMVRGYLLRPYKFSGEGDFYRVLLLIFGALLAFLASLTLFRVKKRRPSY